MEQSVKYYWIQELVSHSCLNHTICTVNHYTSYQNLHLEYSRIQVVNGQFVSALFIIPIIVDIHGHRFELYTLVSEIHENIDFNFKN